MNVSFTRNISNEELELVKANQALKAAEEQRRNIEKYANLFFRGICGFVALYGSWGQE